MGVDLKDFTLKLNLAIKSILNFVKKESGNEGRTVTIQMSSHENRLAFQLNGRQASILQRHGLLMKFLGKILVQLLQAFGLIIWMIRKKLKLYRFIF